MDGIELDEPVLQGKLPTGGDYDDEGNHDGHKGHHKGRCSSKYSTPSLALLVSLWSLGTRKENLWGREGWAFGRS